MCLRKIIKKWSGFAVLGIVLGLPAVSYGKADVTERNIPRFELSTRKLIPLESVSHLDVEDSEQTPTSKRSRFNHDIERNDLLYKTARKI